MFAYNWFWPLSFSPAARPNSCGSPSSRAVSRELYLKESEMPSLIITAICSTAVFTLYWHSLLCFANSLTLSSISLIFVLNPLNHWLIELIFRVFHCGTFYPGGNVLFMLIFNIKFEQFLHVLVRLTVVETIRGSESLVELLVYPLYCK